VIIPGMEDPTRPVPRAMLSVIHAAWRKGARIASICSGAFVLAVTGLLDGRRATIHWMATAELARRFPELTVDRTCCSSMRAASSPRPVRQRASTCVFIWCDAISANPPPLTPRGWWWRRPIAMAAGRN
jgi:putative intracellular protease/amidase